MRVCLIGGSGFVGTHLSNHFKKNHEVTVLDLIPPQVDVKVYQKYDVRVGTPDILPGNFDLIVNLAAIHKNPGHKPHEYFETNVMGALNICKWLKSEFSGTFVHFSSIAVYGNDDKLGDETSPLNPQSDYGRSKVISEHVVREYFLDNANTSLRIVRPGAIFGQGEKGNFTRMARALSRNYFLLPSGKTIYKSVGYVKDLTSAIDFVSSAQLQHDTFNFSFPSINSSIEIVSEFCRVGNFRKPFTLPLDEVLSRFPNILKTNNMNTLIQKLQTSNCFLPTNLQASGFSWSFNLANAVQDWFNDSMFDKK